MTYEEYRDAWWARERQTDADMRAGILPGGERMPYRYVGPPLVLTPEREIERAYLSHVECRARAFCNAMIARASTVDDPPPTADNDFDRNMAQIRALRAAGGWR